MNNKPSRREWARQRISILENELQGLRAFLEVEERYVREASNGDDPAKPRKNMFVPSSNSMASYVKRALRDAPTTGMNAAQVAAKILELGFEYQGTASIKTVVGSELSRLQKRERIAKISTGLYALLPK